MIRLISILLVCLVLSTVLMEVFAYAGCCIKPRGNGTFDVVSVEKPAECLGRGVYQYKDLICEKYKNRRANAETPKPKPQRGVSNTPDALKVKLRNDFDDMNRDNPPSIATDAN